MNDDAEAEDEFAVRFFGALVGAFLGAFALFFCLPLGAAVPIVRL
jgi:hypothetical protein